jgi:hypothetical protein
MKRKLIFHIGLEKTGTDSFQRFCTEHHKLLREYSVLYPMKSCAFCQPNHVPLVASYLPYRDFSMRPSGQARPIVVRSLTAEINQDDSSTVLISSEHFSSRFGDMEIRQLASDFADYDCRVAVVVRDHSSRLYSAYSQTVLTGRDITLDEFCDELFHPDNRYIRYAETILSWERVFGRQNISIFCHSPGKSIIPVLCKDLLSSTMTMPPSSIKSYWDNRSLGPRSVERLRRVNRAIAPVPMDSMSFAGWLLRRYARYGVARLLQKLESYQDRGRWCVDARNLERLAEIAEADCVWLEAHYGVCLSDQATAPALRS